jgi:hypothetical protein
MKTIRWCKTHDSPEVPPWVNVCNHVTRSTAGKPNGIEIIFGSDCEVVERLVIDPSDPEQVAELLTSLGFEREPGYSGPDPDQILQRWVGPWEPAK